MRPRSPPSPWGDPLRGSPYGPPASSWCRCSEGASSAPRSSWAVPGDSWPGVRWLHYPGCAGLVSPASALPAPSPIMWGRSPLRRSSPRRPAFSSFCRPFCCWGRQWASSQGSWSLCSSAGFGLPVCSPITPTGALPPVREPRSGGAPHPDGGSQPDGVPQPDGAPLLPMGPVPGGASQTAMGPVPDGVPLLARAPHPAGGLLAGWGSPPARPDGPPGLEAPDSYARPTSFQRSEPSHWPLRSPSVALGGLQPASSPHRRW